MFLRQAGGGGGGLFSGTLPHQRRHHHPQQQQQSRRRQDHRHLEPHHHQGRRNNILSHHRQDHNPRSRSIGDLRQQHLLQEQRQQQSNNHHRHLPNERQQHQHQRVMVGTEFYRISRRRIIGTAMSAEWEAEEEATTAKAKFVKGRRGSSVNSGGSNNGSPQLSDEGIYLQDYDTSDESDKSFVRKNRAVIERNQSSRMRSKGWVPVFPADVLKEARREAVESRPRLRSMCTCLERPADQQREAMVTLGRRPRTSISQTDLHSIGSRKFPSASNPANNKVSSTRLLKIASFHHLPRVSPIKPRITAASAPTASSKTPSKSSDSHEEEDAKARNNKKGNEEGGKSPSAARRRWSSDSSLQSDESSTADSLDLDMDFFEMKQKRRGILDGLEIVDDEEEEGDDLGSKEEVSLAVIRDSAVVHNYIASRGQREREQEIYEVLPARVTLLKTTQKSGRRRRRPTVFAY